MCLSWTYPKFLHTVPKSHEMDMKISVNNDHMITHLTLEDVTFTYIKWIILLSISWHYPLVYYKISSYDVMYDLNLCANMKNHNTCYMSFYCISSYYNITVMLCKFPIWHDTSYIWKCDFQTWQMNHKMIVSQ